MRIVRQHGALNFRMSREPEKTSFIRWVNSAKRCLSLVSLSLFSSGHGADPSGNPPESLQS